MAITITRDLNVVSVGVPPVIHLSQYDSDFTLVFNLYASTGAFTMPTGTTAEIRGTKRDGNGYDAAATVSGSTVTVTGDEQMTAGAGQNVFEIATYYNNKRLNTINFILDVERAALDADTITSESVLRELNAIIEGAATATQAAEDAKDAADRAEEAADDLSGTVQQVATNTQDIADLKDDLSSIQGITDEIKEALLACFDRVMWIDAESGQSAYDDLYNALYAEQPVIEPKYDFRTLGYEIGNVVPDNMYTWSGSTRTRLDTRLMSRGTLTTRARMKSFMPAVSGTITALDGYEIVVYLFDSIQFDSAWYYDPKTDTRNNFGNTGGLNFDSGETPAWVTSFTIEDPDCKYIYMAFRKTNAEDWTQAEMSNMYGTVFTASVSPSYKLFDIAEYTGGYSYTNGGMVKDEEVIDGGMTHKRDYIQKIATSARAIVDYLPITNGIFRSADPSKYQICLYQIDNQGGCIWDTENPYISETNGFPAWADEFDLSLNPKQSEVFCVCISFKKLDGTDFTQEELSNMYGTVFTYEEV